MAKQLRLGVAGVGAGARGLISNIAKVQGYVLTAAADTRPEALDELRAKYEIETYDDVAAMCKSPNIDVVYVATPNQFHIEHVIAAAENGKHIMCEKIMAVTFEEAKREFEAAESNHVKFLTIHRVSAWPPVDQMYKIVSSGQLGKVIQITNVHYSPWMCRPRLPEEWDSRFGGGVVYRQAPYHVDMARLMAGGIVRSVRATVGRYDREHPLTEGNYSAFLDFENGATANLTYNGYGFFDTAEVTRALGDDTVGEGDPGGPGQRSRQALVMGASKEDMRSGRFGEMTGSLRSEEQTAREAHPFFGLTIVSCELGDLRQTAHGIMINTDKGATEVPSPSWDQERQMSLRTELEELYVAITQNKPILHDGRWGAANVEVCDAMLISSRERREVHVSHQVAVPERR